jgi:hypothetical protein
MTDPEQSDAREATRVVLADLLRLMLADAGAARGQGLVNKENVLESLDRKLTVCLFLTDMLGDPQ